MMSAIALRLRHTWQSGFVRSVAVLTGGSGVAMAVPILAAPLLGRLYMPADYGALALYMAPAAVLAVLASLQFQHSIIVERTDRGAGGAAWLVLMSALVMAGLTAVVVAALWEPVLSRTTVGTWFAALPVSVAGAGVVATGTFLANRYRRYRFIAQTQIFYVLATVALSITLGFLGWGANGLLSAYFLGVGVNVISHLWLLYQCRASLLPRPRAARLRVLVRRHWRFPIFTLPSEFSGQINMQTPIFALGALGADATLGSFTRARQLVSMPVTLVGGSVAQVFRREAAQMHHNTGSCRALMLRTAGWLLAVGLGPCVLFMLFAPWLFAVYLGPAWYEAGEIARILAPMLLLRLVVLPVATVFYFTGNQVLDLRLMISSAVLMALCICLGWRIGGTSMSVIWAFSGGYTVIYLMYGFFAWKIARNPLASVRISGGKD